MPIVGLIVSGKIYLCAHLDSVDFIDSIVISIVRLVCRADINIFPVN